MAGFIEKFMGEQLGKSMGGSMLAAELGALSSVADVLIRHGKTYGSPRVLETGVVLLTHLDRRVRAEVLLMPDEKEVKPSQE